MGSLDDALQDRYEEGYRDGQNDMDRRAADWLAGFFQAKFREGEQVTVDKAKTIQEFVDYVSDQGTKADVVDSARSSITRVVGLTHLLFGQTRFEEN